MLKAIPDDRDGFFAASGRATQDGGHAAQNFTFTDKPEKGHVFGMINKDFLKKRIRDSSGQFYICGPDKMVKAIDETQEQLGAKPEEITFEK